MSLDPLDVALNDERGGDPLKSYVAMSWAQEFVFRNFYGHDGLLLGGNKSGKSDGLIALDLAIARGLRQIKGCPWNEDGSPRPAPVIQLPYIPPPVDIGLGVLSYKVAAGSTLSILRRLLGSWPYVEVKQGGQLSVQMVLIKHSKSPSNDPDETWTRFYVFPYDGERPEGVRLDLWHCDEPPPDDFLTAFRTRAKSGRRLSGYIGMTPAEVSGWEPIVKQYPKEQKVFSGGRYTLQSSVYDNHALTPQDLLDAEAALAGIHPLTRKARLYGDPVDASGFCPFNLDRLQSMLARAVEPERLKLRVMRTRDSGGEEGLVMERVPFELEVFEPPVPGDEYLMPMDPARGMDDGRHDPDGLHVWSRSRKKLVARVNGYYGAYGLSQIGALVGKRYNMALAHPLVTGGLGETLLQGLRDAGYNRISRQRFEVQRGKWASRPGFAESVESNREWKGAVERSLWSMDWTIPSRAVIRTLMDVVEDERGYVDVPKNQHNEDWVCLGSALQHMHSQKFTVPDREGLQGEIERYRQVALHGDLAGGDEELLAGW